MKLARTAILAALLLMLGVVVSITSAIMAAAWSNVDSWGEERPVPATPAHLPAYLRGVWPEPAEVTTNPAAAWGVSQTTITCVHPAAWPEGRVHPAPASEAYYRLYIFRSSFGWPLRCMHYDRFGNDRTISGPGNRRFFRDLEARAGSRAGGTFPAWFPYDHSSWMGAQRRMPLSFVWHGLVINTLLYAAAVLALARVILGVRRECRRRRSLCERCAYPRGPTDTCPECGQKYGRPRAPAELAQ